MAYLLFLDESGQDHHESPYEVLAGMTVEDRDLWNLVQEVQEAEVRCFGCRYTEGRQELKGKKLLKRKTFRLAAQLPPRRASHDFQRQIASAPRAPSFHAASGWMLPRNAGHALPQALRGQAERRVRLRRHCS